MRRLFKIIVFVFLISSIAFSQDLSQGYLANDLSNRSMKMKAKPEYLDTIIDPSFPSSVIRRITNADAGKVIAPIYNTIQAWNANEQLMLVYTSGTHQLLNGNDYSFIRTLTDVSSADIETIFWHFSDPDLMFYHESGTNDFIEYNVQTGEKNTIVNLKSVSNCTGGISMGNDVQMMSWDSDVFCFRCANSDAYSYKISSDKLTRFNLQDVAFTAPMPFPSGKLFYHQKKIYGEDGEFLRDLNLNKVEHSCLGQLSNGDDAYFAIAFEEGPASGCQGSLVAHNATNGNCFTVTPPSEYGYPKSGTHISSLAHKNSEKGWVAVSMMGYELDGQRLFDQELFVAKVNENSSDVYRVAHHRSDEEQFDYFGEPHVTISPTGTRLLFGSDWSGAEDGLSVDCYVVELPAFRETTTALGNKEEVDVSLYPIPVVDEFNINVQGGFNQAISYEIYSTKGRLLTSGNIENSREKLDVSSFISGTYLLKLRSGSGFTKQLSFVVE